MTLKHGYKNIFGDGRIQVPLFEIGTTTFDAILTDWFFGTVVLGGAITGSLSQTLGALTVSASGQLPIAGAESATLGAMTLAATGTLRISGTATANLGAVTLAGNGALRLAGTLSQSFGNVTVAGSGLLRIAGSLSQSLGELTIAATGNSVSGIVGTAELALGELSISATGALPISGTVDILFGAMVFYGHNATPEAPIEVTAEFSGISVRGSHINSMGWLAAQGERRPRLRSIFRAHRLQREEDEIRRMQKRAKRRPIDRQTK